MKNQIEKFRTIERMISDERGSFSLFGLFLREEAPNRWDVVLSAPWVEDNRQVALRYTVGKIQAVLDPEEVIQLSHVALLDKESPIVEAVNQAVQVEHGVFELPDGDVAGLGLERAYVITSRSPASALEVA